MVDEIAIEAVVWATRRMNKPVSSVYAFSGNFLAGDWDGKISCWSSEGELLWSVELGDRISSIIRLHDGHFSSATGLSIVELDANGKLLWSTQLEGSSEQVIELENNHIFATSAVWDIEHGDFMEGAIWCVDRNGDVVYVNRFDEKIWSIEQIAGKMVLALSHPRCGIVLCDEKGLTHIELNDFPTTSLLSKGNRILVGTADGKIHQLFISKPNNLSLKMFEVSNLVINILSFENKLIIVSENEVVMTNSEFEIIWSWESQKPIEHGVCYSDDKGDPLICIISGKDDDSKLHLLDFLTGDLQLNLLIGSTVHDIETFNSFLLLGLENGLFHILEKNTLNRRMEQQSEELVVEGDAAHQRSSMMERLRSLRGNN